MRRSVGAIAHRLRAARRGCEDLRSGRQQVRDRRRARALLRLITEVLMEPTPLSPPTQHVYRGHGNHSVRLPLCQADDEGLLQVPTIADLVPVRRIMTRDVICAREDLDLATLLELMVRRHIGCVPIVDERGRPIGMVTKFDAIEQLVTEPKPGGKRPIIAGDLMMPLALTLDEHASVGDAAAMMAVEDVHHVVIIAESGALIGVVSTMDIVRWLTANDSVPVTDEEPG